jgi:hypothetical protein
MRGKLVAAIAETAPAVVGETAEIAGVTSIRRRNLAAIGLGLAAVVATLPALAQSNFSSADTAAAELGPQTHWEPYRNSWMLPPSEDQHLKDPILEGAVDLHAHHGPDAYPRQWDGFEVAALAAERGLRAIVLKNHWTETAGLAYLVRKYGGQDVEVFGAVTLDTPVGGVNPQAVRYMIDVTGGYGRIVWMPTHDSEHEVKFLGEDRPFVRVSDRGELLPETLEVLALIAEHDLTLATGHVTPAEALLLLEEARQLGIERIIVTHPLLGEQYTYMSDEQLAAAVELGGSIEITANTLYGSGAAQARAIELIRTLGAEHVFVGSDSGLTGTPNHPDALVMAARALRAAGFSERELELMFKVVPARLIGLVPAAQP